MRHYEELATYEREGFEIIVDKTYEEIDPWDQLSECVDSKEQLYADLESGKYDWFVLRVRVLVEGHELASEYLGGMLYEDARECLKDGSAEDMIYEAIAEARKEAQRLVGSLAKVVDTETV
jgi:hypothetical protein